MFDIKIYNFIDASSLASFVEFEWGIPHSKAYDRLIENDYIEGSFGSKHCKDDPIVDDVSSWIKEFLKRWNLDHVYLRY